MKIPAVEDDGVSTEAVRDLLGIVRGIFHAWAKESGRAAALEQLFTIAGELDGALSVMMRSLPGTAPRLATDERVRTVCAMLENLVDASTPLKPVLNAAFKRAVRQRRRSRRHRTSP